jgi:hypothetical protein
MVIINGQAFNTVVDAAEALGVSARRSVLHPQGHHPATPEIQYGVRVLRHYPREYLRDARKLSRGTGKTGLRDLAPFLTGSLP